MDSILLHKTFYDFMRSNEGREEYSEEFNYRFSPSNIIKLKKDHVYEIWFGVWFYSWCQGQSKDGSALLIMNNDPTSLFLDLDSITVKHSDIKPPEIVWWEGSGNFGTVKKDTTVTKSFTLKNIGTLPATGEVYRTGSGNFQITQGGGDFSLDGGETKTIKVKFTPTSRGVSYSGELIARGYNYQNAEMDLYGVCSNSKVKNNEIRFQSYLESWIESLIERFPSLEFFTSFFYQNYNVCSDMNIGYPDLIMTSFRTEPVIVDGYIIPGVREVLFDIKNDGDVSANLPNNLKIVKMININFGYDNDFYIWTGLYGPPIELKPGDSLTLSSSSNWHGGVPIGSKLKFILDPENKIDEGPEGEDNNHVSYKIPLVKNTNLFQKWLT
ncbi:MAG: hypothetical protein QCI00_09450 [Candidatus Thermoplasmatota archaeon]|nr:hypothetical protein [Candidatus Thermoplasmatota archaeon]